MQRTKWILLFVVVAVLLHKVVVSSKEIDTEVDKREIEDEAMAMEVIKRLAEMSDSNDELVDEKDELNKRAIKKRGWWRRAWRWVKNNVKVKVGFKTKF